MYARGHMLVEPTLLIGQTQFATMLEEGSTTQAQEFLRDLAFVLQATQKVKKALGLEGYSQRPGQ